MRKNERPRTEDPLHPVARMPELDATENDLSAGTVTDLLRLGQDAKRRTVDELIDRLIEERDPAWFERMLEAGPPGSCGPVRKSLHDGGASLPDVIRIKNGSKAAFHRSSPEERLSGIAGYFLAVAAARIHHGATISSRPREEVDGVLLDLASSAPAPWDEFLFHAVELARK